MTPVTPFLVRYAWALIAGAGVATLAANVAPDTYYDLLDWRLADLPGYGALTPTAIVMNFLMAGFIFLVGKEALEALTSEGRPTVAPLTAAGGGMIGSAAVWLILSALFETADEAAGAPGWAVPMGSDVVLAYLFGRMVFGPSHRALQLLLFLATVDTLAGLLVAALVTPGLLAPRLGWLILPVIAAVVVWWGLTRPLARTDASELDRLRARRLWPWIAAGLVSWAGVALAGLPGCLGFLPILPVMPHAARSFGLFARAEDFLTDPLSRLSARMHGPMVAVMALFGLVQGGIDLGAISPTTGVSVGALVLGQPLGVLIGGALGGGLSGPRLSRPDVWRVAALSAIGFTAPVLAMATALPGGAMQEGARVGFALSVLIGPLIVLAARRR